MLLFYKDWNLDDAVTNTIQAHPSSSACESWARTYLRLSASPDGKFQPAFIHAPDTTMKYTEISMSRENPRILEVIVIVVKRLIQALGFQPGDLAIVIPYKAQLGKLKERLGKYAVHVDKGDHVHLTTADKVQGAERKMILFLMVNTTTAGAGFVFDPNRLKVISNRATDFLIVIGDRKVAVQSPGQTQFQVDSNLSEWIT